MVIDIKQQLAKIIKGDVGLTKSNHLSCEIELKFCSDFSYQQRCQILQRIINTLAELQEHLAYEEVERVEKGD